MREWWARRSRWQKIGLVVGAVIVLLAVIPTDEEPEPEALVTTTTTATTTTTVPTTTTEPEPITTTVAGTAGASLACDHFRNIIRDVGDGLYTDEELRAKLREVVENASIGTSDMQDAARAMLGAVTQGDAEAFVDAVEDMHEACQATGN